MGLFSFLKDAGAKLLTGKAAKKVSVDKPPKNASKEAYNDKEVLRHQKMILLRGVAQSTGIKVKNLEIDLNGDKVTVYGATKSVADKEKLVLALGNVAGIATVDDRIIVKNTEAKTIAREASEFYTVKKGDSLSKIAKKYYGSAKKYQAIFEANQPMLTDPNKIYPGQKLRIPPMS